MPASLIEKNMTHATFSSKSSILYIKAAGTGGSGQRAVSGKSCSKVQENKMKNVLFICIALLALCLPVSAANPVVPPKPVNRLQAEFAFWQAWSESVGGSMTIEYHLGKGRFLRCGMTEDEPASGNLIHTVTGMLGLKALSNFNILAGIMDNTGALGIDLNLRAGPLQHRFGVYFYGLAGIKAGTDLYPETQNARQVYIQYRAALMWSQFRRLYLLAGYRNAFSSADAEKTPVIGAVIQAFSEK